jgi:hypothetical protein
MPINPLIALSVESMDTGDAAEKAVQNKRQGEIDAQEAELRSYQIANEKLRGMTEREQARYDSVITGAAELGTYLEGGNVEGAKKFLQQRRAALGQRIAAGEEVDTAQTDEALAALNSGDQKQIDGLKSQINQLVKLGQMRGTLKTGEDGSYSLSPGQKRFDSMGNVIASVDKPPEGMKAVTNPETGEVTYEPTRKLSATDTKEIYDASDVIQAGEGAKSALTRALQISEGGATGEEKKPYSGFGATMRAGAARLPVLGDIVADPKRGAATTEYSSLIKEQALGSMKAIFGGNPTEGERQVLLQMQAIADYTPDEQKRIINNALSAIERRQVFNKKKIDAIEKGDYTSLGFTEEEGEGKTTPTQNKEGAETQDQDDDPLGLR